MEKLDGTLSNSHMQNYNQIGWVSKEKTKSLFKFSNSRNFFSLPILVSWQLL